MTEIAPLPDAVGTSVDVLVIGAGAAGLCAALAASEAGAEVLVVERDRTVAGSTAMSSGFVPAAGTRAQRALGIEDDPARFAADIQAKAGGRAEPGLVRLATSRIAPVLDWLETRHGFAWQVLDDFLYPGHTRHRMHTLPERTGAALIARLAGAAEAAGIPILTEARAGPLLCDGPRVAGARLTRRDGRTEDVACRNLILACNGFGANRDLVSRHIPEMAAAPYYGHAGNEGDALIWGAALGAEARCLSACQGHGSLAHPQAILITWALMMEGGVQINARGRRFANEHAGYSEHALSVLAQPGGTAWAVFDEARLALARSFPDFRAAEAAGALRSGADAGALAAATGLPDGALGETLEACAAMAVGARSDPLGRDFTASPALAPPYHAVKVTGALFHTQGGLMIGPDASVLRPDGSAIAGLFAAGGAACGVSGPALSGYLSGNGLLTALAFGWQAGQSAASAGAVPR